MTTNSEERPAAGNEQGNGLLSRTCTFLRQRLPVFRRAGAGSGQFQTMGWLRTEGSELVELALLVPILLVMVGGIMDFGTAYNLKQKLANAAREGARLGASQPHADLSTSSPASVQAIKDDVTTYLQQAGVDTSFIGSSMSYDPATPCTATYYTTSGGVNYGLEIKRCIPIVDTSGTILLETQVTLTYPYGWTYGFNHVIKLMVPSALIASTIAIETDATMANLS